MPKRGKPMPTSFCLLYCLKIHQWDPPVLSLQTYNQTHAHTHFTYKFCSSFFIFFQDLMKFCPATRYRNTLTKQTTVKKYPWFHNKGFRFDS